MNKILLKKNKVDNYLLDKHNRLFIYFGFVIFILAISYVFFLFMSVSYTYAQNKDSYKLNNLITENVELKNSIFKKEINQGGKIVASNFVRIKNIKYIKRGNPVIVKLNN